MSDAAPPKPPTTADLLSTLIDEIRGLREDMRRSGTLPDVKIGKAKMRDWHGPSYEGRVASECPAEFLLEYAGFLEWRAGKRAEEEKVQEARADERTANYCRRWATLNRGIRAAAKSDEAPTTQDSRREAPSGEAPKPKWGGGGWKSASGA